jgi:hypothetical protein
MVQGEKRAAGSGAARPESGQLVIPVIAPIITAMVPVTIVPGSMRIITAVIVIAAVMVVRSRNYGRLLFRNGRLPGRK